MVVPGRLERSVTEFEPDFDDADRQAAFAWQIEEQLRCRGCGRPTDETMSPDAEGRYIADVWICHACAPAEAALDAHRRDGNRMFGVTARIRDDGPGIDLDGDMTA